MNVEPISHAFQMIGPDTQLQTLDADIQKMEADMIQNPQNADKDKQEIDYDQQEESCLKQMVPLAKAYQQSDNDSSLAEKLQALNQQLEQLMKENPNVKLY